MSALGKLAFFAGIAVSPETASPMSWAGGGEPGRYRTPAEVKSRTKSRKARKAAKLARRRNRK